MTRPPRYALYARPGSTLPFGLRLDAGGPPLHFALPRPPSADPSERRLAFRLEEEPAERAGETLDAGGLALRPGESAAEGLAKGKLSFELRGGKAQGTWHLVRTGKRGRQEGWLLIRGKSALQAEAAPPPAARPAGKPERLLDRVWPPMLARLSTPEELRGQRPVLEVKYDGFRALAALAGGKLALHSRNRKDVSARFPEVARALRALEVREAVLDGEVVAFDKKGVSRFQLMQTPGKEPPLHYAAFDLLWLDGVDLRRLPLEARRARLEAVLRGAPEPLLLAERVAGPLSRALAAARRSGSEGVIAKDPDSPYQGGRGDAWLKLKVRSSQEVVILGYTPHSKGRPEIGALVVGVREGPGYRAVGKVGTGYTRATRQELLTMLQRERLKRPLALSGPQPRKAIWVEPRHVANVEFAEWTRDGVLRSPVFQGLRSDKRPAEVVRELPPARGARRVPGPALAARTARAGKAPPAEALLTHGERELYPEGFTKADVFAYYRAVAPALVPVLRDRPLILEQAPQGVAKGVFFRQSVAHAPPWVPTISATHEARVIEHVDVRDARVLLWLANQSALALHCWLSHAPSLERPDWLLLDLDPGERTRPADLVRVAQRARRELEAAGLESLPKTTGGSGLHLVVPLGRTADYEAALRFAEVLAGRVAAALPELATTERAVGKRGGRLYVDWLQNAYGKSMVAPYSLRAAPGARASTPLRWSEVTPRLDVRRFDLRSVPRRLDRLGDLFAPARTMRQRLPRLT